jgi:zinc-ribbon domain
MPAVTYLNTECQHCSGHIEYPSELGGGSIQCPHCQQVTTLPLPVTSPPPPLPITPPYKKMSETTPTERSKLLRPCPDCGHQISKEALICPSCGRRVTFISAIFFAALFISLVFAMIVALFVILIGILGLHSR